MKRLIITAAVVVRALLVGGATAYAVDSTGGIATVPCLQAWDSHITYGTNAAGQETATYDSAIVPAPSGCIGTDILKMYLQKASAATGGFTLVKATSVTIPNNAAGTLRATSTATTVVTQGQSYRVIFYAAVKLDGALLASSEPSGVSTAP